MCSTALCWICFAALETAVADVCPPQLPLHMSSAAATACQWLLLQQDQLLHLWLWGRQINIAQANSARTLHVLSNFQSKCLTRTKRFPTHWSVKQVTGSTLRLLRVTHNIALWYKICDYQQSNHWELSIVHTAQSLNLFWISYCILEIPAIQVSDCY